MWANWETDSHRHYYVKELASTSNNKYVIPVRWIEFDGTIYAEAYSVAYSPQVRQMCNRPRFYLIHDLNYFHQTEEFCVDISNIVRIEASTLSQNYLDIEAAMQKSIRFSGAKRAVGAYTILMHHTQILVLYGFRQV